MGDRPPPSRGSGIRVRRNESLAVNEQVRASVVAVRVSDESDVLALDQHVDEANDEARYGDKGEERREPLRVPCEPLRRQAGRVSGAV